MAGRLALGAALLLACVRADVITRIPDAAPPGFEEWESPIVSLSLLSVQFLIPKYIGHPRKKRDWRHPLVQRSHKGTRLCRPTHTR